MANYILDIDVQRTVEVGIENRLDKDGVLEKVLEDDDVPNERKVLNNVVNDVYVQDYENDDVSIEIPNLTKGSKVKIV